MFKELFFSFFPYFPPGKGTWRALLGSLTEVEQVMKREVCVGMAGEELGRKILDKRKRKGELVYQWKDIPNRDSWWEERIFCWKVILNGEKKIFFCWEVPKRRGGANSRRLGGLLGFAGRS